MSDLPGDSFWVVEGEVLAGPYPGAESDAAAEAKLAAHIELGVEVFLDLTEECEGLRPYAPWLRTPAVTYIRMAIPDVSVPPTWLMVAIQATIAEARAADRMVYVHCWGGVGRTGTVFGCLLRESGCPADGVMDAIAAARANTARAHRASPETWEQREFVRSWR